MDDPEIPRKRTAPVVRRRPAQWESNEALCLPETTSPDTLFTVFSRAQHDKPQGQRPVVPSDAFDEIQQQLEWEAGERQRSERPTNG
ncbi:hypothetical protein F53441_14049 [Fusarium austroafricanum]|uniref:Uncharacterized protein n=1 Tax=Fusarium austroafricanum TaxID=2364996 RepID=A0A8H4JH95_9HYPO|nr:hypothetical protein F53441_14049 [Fusarium austroafricanum]